MKQIEKIIREDFSAYLLIAVGIITFIFLAFMFDGTGDEGDSVHHFVISQQAFQDTDLFFLHWGKPLFVLLSAPFAQFDFVGMKIFNILCLLLSLIFSLQIAKQLGFTQRWLIPIVYFTAYSVWTLTLSGLTEPLFACFLAISVYLFVIKRTISSVLLMSFLPFLRSEGLVVLCVIVLYLLLIQKWKYIHLLLVGHILYGITGAKVYGSVLWPFTHIPYASLASVYGFGKWHHFILNMPEVVGIVLTFVLYAGIIYGAIRLIQYWKNPSKHPFSKEELWLIYGIFVAFFVAHSLFWALGIFNSFGLMRVMLGVMPLISLICVRFLGEIIAFVAKKTPSFSPYFKGIIVIVLGYFLYIKINPSDFKQNLNQLAINKMADKYKAAWLENKENTYFYFDHAQVAWKLGLNLYMSHEHRWIDQLKHPENVPHNSIIIWDEFMAAGESGLTLSSLQQSKDFRFIESIKATNDVGNQSATIYLFRRDTSHIPEQKALALLYENGFEKDKDLKGHVTNPVAEGKYAFLVNKENPFSPGYSADLGDISKIRIRLQAKTDYFPQVNWESAKCVISIDKDGKNLFWEGYELQTLMKKEDIWQEIVIEQDLPLYSATKNKLSIYIWNERDYRMYVDKLKVEVLEPPFRTPYSVL